VQKATKYKQDKPPFRYNKEEIQKTKRFKLYIKLYITFMIKENINSTSRAKYKTNIENLKQHQGETKKKNSFLGPTKD